LKSSNIKYWNNWKKEIQTVKWAKYGSAKHRRIKLGTNLPDLESTGKIERNQNWKVETWCFRVYKFVKDNLI
jgi:hypothetical protein